MRVTILRGLSGAGKSTFAKEIANGNGLIVSADDFFMTTGKYVFDSTQLSAAHGRCLRSFVNAIQQNIPCAVVDNTNSTVREIAPYAALALAYGHDLEIVTLKIAPEDAIKRTTHNVPEKTIMRMAERLDKEAQYFPSYWNHRMVEAKL